MLTGVLWPVGSPSAGVHSVGFDRRARFCYNASWPANLLALILKLCRRLNCSPRTVEGAYNSLPMRRLRTC